MNYDNSEPFCNSSSVGLDNDGKAGSSELENAGHWQ